MARYYAHITGAANINTVFNPFISYTGNGNYLRIEYAGNITTNATANVYVWRQTSSNWFSFEQGSFEQYLNLGSTTYVPDVNNTAANRRKFNSDNPNNPAVFDLNNGTANLTFNNWTTTGTYTGDFSNNGIVFFPSSTAQNLIMDFYGFKVYGRNDTLLYDFVSDYNGSEMGLRDKVSGRFYTATDQSKIQLFSLTTFEIQPEEEYVLYTSGTTTIALTADESLTWTASTSDSWLSLSTLTGAGDGSVMITYEENGTFQSRTGTVTFTSSEGDVLAFTIEQEQKPVLVYDHPIYRSGSLVKKMYRSGELIYLRLNPPSEEPPVPPTPPSPLEEPVTLTITAAGNIKWYAQNNSYTKTIQYSKNGGEWTNITSSQAGTMIPVVAGDVVRLRGDNAQYAPVDGRCSCFSGTTAGFTLSGNIMSLVDSTNFATLSSFTAENVFMNFFNNCTGLTDASDLLLPATALTNYCYQGLLAQCTSLLKGPLLSVETLTTKCYAYFYYHTYNLQEIRCLAVTTTASNCLQEWVNGVQTSSGTFYKNPNKTDWGRGNAGVPNNWTIVDYS